MPDGTNATVIISPFAMWMVVGSVTIDDVVVVGEAQTRVASVPVPFNLPVHLSPFL